MRMTVTPVVLVVLDKLFEELEDGVLGPGLGLAAGDCILERKVFDNLIVSSKNFFDSLAIILVVLLII